MAVRKAKPASKAAPKESAGKRAAAKDRDIDLTERVLELRSQDKTWDEIADKLKITPGKAQFLKMCSDVKPKDRIKGTDDEIAAGIVAARNDDEQSWGRIAARAGLPEGKVKKLYESASGKSSSGQRVGRKAAAKPAAAKKTTKRRVVRKKGSKDPQ